MVRKCCEKGSHPYFAVCIYQKDYTTRNLTTTNGNKTSAFGLPHDPVPPPTLLGLRGPRNAPRIGSFVFILFSVFSLRKKV